MRAWVELSISYSQQLMQSPDFQAEFDFTYNDEGMINGIFKDNEVVDNDEQTFRAEVLNTLRNLFHQVTNVAVNEIEIINDGQMNPVRLRWITAPQPRRREIASIQQIEN